MAVKDLLGHESIELTLRYAHASPDVKRDGVKLLDLSSQVPSDSDQAQRVVGDRMKTP